MFMSGELDSSFFPSHSPPPMERRLEQRLCLKAVLLAFKLIFARTLTSHPFEGESRRQDGNSVLLYERKRFSDGWRLWNDLEVTQPSLNSLPLGKERAPSTA